MNERLAAIAARAKLLGVTKPKLRYTQAELDARDDATDTRIRPEDNFYARQLKVAIIKRRALRGKVPSRNP